LLKYQQKSQGGMRLLFVFAPHVTYTAVQTVCRKHGHSLVRY